VELLTNPHAWISLATLTALEIVLGVDNIIFISILVGRLPEAQRGRGRTIGLALAMGTRIMLLLSLAWIMKLTTPLFVVLEQGIAGRDLILISGGLFLLWKSVHEIHNALEGEPEDEQSGQQATFTSVVLQIAVLDIVFSLDSVITAVGLAEHIEIMIAAVMVSVAVMMLAAASISAFVDNHPTIKMLALAFLIMVAMTLLAEGVGFHIPKGYVYFAMAFSIAVETLNLRVSARAKRARILQLHKRFED
jgi:predicted tellurium resistance membrane protein TerC